ncbi:TPA: hypothetical protein N0F65_000206 [Lagenidium giganteum]|uniref:NADH dehydrogenase [ubiquinone] 1 alpha subcomplex subunit 11 n=1 Tax=Lagenidium giganteum TaxID=4803 RepID=A0AAV2Y9Y9_9STRA|nr:TPA: hypothetical protein N0F65_000206 [Lagenidium giganteum]
MEGPQGSEKIVAATATGAFFGAAAGSVESVWSIPKLGAKLPKFSAQIKHVGVRALVFAAVGGIYASGEVFAESVRQKNDAVNAAIGGALVGVVPAVMTRNMRVAAAASVASATLMGASTFWASSQVSAFEKYEAARLAERS